MFSFILFQEPWTATNKNKRVFDPKSKTFVFRESPGTEFLKMRKPQLWLDWLLTRFHISCAAAEPLNPTTFHIFAFMGSSDEQSNTKTTVRVVNVLNTGKVRWKPCNSYTCTCWPMLYFIITYLVLTIHNFPKVRVRSEVQINIIYIPSVIVIITEPLRVRSL